jgi:hypothetical protein
MSAEWITRYEYAKRHKISLPTVYNHFKEGLFPKEAIQVEPSGRILLLASHPFFYKPARPHRRG